MEAALALSDERVLLDRQPGVVVAEGITRRFGDGDTAVDALRGVSLGVARGELTAVMGPSGSGKSTLMHILAGLDRPTSGTVAVGGTEITKLSDRDLTKLRSSSRISALVRESRLPVGSSAKSTVGREMSARPIATRCCWPPESSDGRCRRRSSSPTARRISSTQPGSGFVPAI